MGAVIERKDDLPALAEVLEQTAPRGSPQFPAPRFSLVADHGARKRAALWQAYQAAWQKPIDELECSAERFYNLRRNVLSLNRKQTARLLRVGVTSVLNWETGVHPVPFYAYLALLLVSESLHYRLANEEWQDWQMVERFNADGALPRKKQRSVSYLVNRRTGASYTPEVLDYIHEQVARASAIESEAHRLRGQLDNLAAENAALREKSGVDGMTAELDEMRGRLEAMLSRVREGSRQAGPGDLQAPRSLTDCPGSK